MFEDCYLRVGQGELAGCVPVSATLLASLYALPRVQEPNLAIALAALGADVPWASSLEAAPEHTSQAIAAMLRQLMLATGDLRPAAIDTGSLPAEGRARRHLEALLALWSSHEVVPADIAVLGEFLKTSLEDALQPVAVIWDRNRNDLSPLERAVMMRLEQHHGAVPDHDPDLERLVGVRQSAAASATTLLGHVQRHLLAEQAAGLPQDASLAMLSVRDSLSECEAAAAVIQKWLSMQAGLEAKDIAVILPNDTTYALHAAEAFARAGLVISRLPKPASARNIGAEVVLHFVQCRRRPAPAMALASLYCSPLMSWDAATGNQLARAVMEGDFAPAAADKLAGRAATLYDLVRRQPPSDANALRDELQRFGQLLCDDHNFRDDVFQARGQIARLSMALASVPASSAVDWDAVIRLAADFGDAEGSRGPYYLGGITALAADELPQRQFAKLVVLGFNDGRYPASPGGNPFFLDSEVADINRASGLRLPSLADRLQTALGQFRRQLCAAREQLVILLSERDLLGDALAPSATLPFISRLVAGLDDPEKLIMPLSRSGPTIWDQLVEWQPPLEYKSVAASPVPEAFDLGIDLLALRMNKDGTPKPQSPSRLEKMLVSPLAWLLAELGASHLSWQPETLDTMLRGSLAHEVFEHLFQPGETLPDEKVIAERVPVLLGERIRAIAPFLQGSAWAVERIALEAEIIKAARRWARLLGDMGAQVVGNEFWLQGSLFGHPVHGKADCLLKLPNGQPVVIDYKKSSAGKRRERLKKGWDLQVELYRQMEVRVGEHSAEEVHHVARTLSTWNGDTAVGYHTLNDGSLLLNGLRDAAHPEAEHIDGEIARKATSLIQSRFDALRNGRVETNTTADRKLFEKDASLGAYALDDSPLVTAFTRADDQPSVKLDEGDDD